jgi:hypothetical protein
MGEALKSLGDNSGAAAAFAKANPAKKKKVRMRDKSERVYVSRKPRKCPSCGAKPIASILYGYPTFSAELKAQLQSGTIALGGCCVTDDDPTWTCTHCGQIFYRSIK